MLTAMMCDQGSAIKARSRGPRISPARTVDERAPSNALLESAAPHVPQFTWNWRTARNLAANLHTWLSDLARQSPTEFISRLQRRTKALQKRLYRSLARPKEESPSRKLADLIDMEVYPKDYIRYAQAHWQALLAYKPQAYPGRITLFRARKQPLLCLDPTLGWGQLAKDGVEFAEWTLAVFKQIATAPLSGSVTIAI